MEKVVCPICWSGDIKKDLPHHLYLINIENLPIVDVKKITIRKPKQESRK